MTNKIRSVLYIGVTSNLLTRIEQHRKNIGSKFTQKYNIKYLLYFEEYDIPTDAIAREKRLKKWKRSWKLDLIKKKNPDLIDLYPFLVE